MKSIFYKFWENLFTIFRGRNLLWHLFAIVLTYIAIVSGFDWTYFWAFNGTFLQKVLFPAVVLGGLLPIFLPGVLYVLGKVKNNITLFNTALATAQAGILGWCVTSLYKTFTGRMEPPIFSASMVDTSGDFQFGFLRHGIFWGWPSSHTAVAFAIAVALAVLYPRNWTLRITAFISALYVGLGVSMSIHWFSDFLAGAIIGSLIGFVVAKAFLTRLNL